MAFLEAPFFVASLHLRTSVETSKASYAGALVWGGPVVGTEIQLTGDTESAVVLAERLINDVEIVRCFVFANVGEGKVGRLVVEEGKFKIV